MTDKIYPTSKPSNTTTPIPTPPTTIKPPPSKFTPPTKPQQYIPTRHPHRPTPAYLAGHDRRRFTPRRCCFLFFCWAILFLIFLILLSSIAATALYFLYNPKRPTFSISSLKISQLNLTTTQPDDSTRLTTKLNLTLSCKNPNKKIKFFYDQITLKTYSMDEQVLLANGTFPGFTSSENNVTIIHTTLSIHNQVLDADSVKGLKSDFKKKTGVPIKLVLETKVKVKMDKIKVRKFDIVVTCEGIHGQIPKGKIAGTATTLKAKCKVDPKFKIWKVTF